MADEHEMATILNAQATHRFPDSLKREAPNFWTPSILDHVRAFYRRDMQTAYDEGRQRALAEGAAQERAACMKAVCGYCRIGDPYDAERKAHKLVKGAPAMSITRYDACRAEALRARGEKGESDDG